MNKILLFRILPALALGFTGLLAAYAGSQYRLGSLAAMGPGFMPLLLGLCLLALALFLLWFERRPTTPLPALPLRPLICVAAGVMAWALLAEPAGFLVAGAMQLLLSALALPGTNWRWVLPGVLVMVIIAHVIFVVLLGLPLAAVGR